MRSGIMWAAGTLLTGLLASPLSAAGGSPPVSAPAPSRAPAAKSAEQLAVEYYEYGLGHRDKAWKLEEKAANDAGKSEKLLAKAREQYSKAIAEIESLQGIA